MRSWHCELTGVMKAKQTNRPKANGRLTTATLPHAFMENRIASFTTMCRDCCWYHLLLCRGGHWGLENFVVFPGSGASSLLGEPGVEHGWSQSTKALAVRANFHLTYGCITGVVDSQIMSGTETFGDKRRRTKDVIIREIVPALH